MNPAASSCSPRRDALAGQLRETWEARARRALARLLAALVHEFRIQRDMRALIAMDDHMLKDIGISRSEIGSAVRFGRDHPSSHRVVQ